MQEALDAALDSLDNRWDTSPAGLFFPKHPREAGELQGEPPPDPYQFPHIKLDIDLLDPGNDPTAPTGDQIESVIPELAGIVVIA